MNESTGATASSSCLAITEKKPRKTGGCVGIFFQLFDWNRRLAKKKLFSKKLLPPARSKKFGGDEKLPNLRLIADENSGGFPNVKKIGGTYGCSELKNGARTPSLVARLMGLESMPSIQQDKLKKGSWGENGGGGRDKFAGDDGEFEKGNEKGNTRHEFRPQKLQKTGIIERRPVTRCGAEALQLKNVLSRSRKHHHPKLASPVKSPRHHSGRNTSRLIGAATRILEPGLQGRSKAKCALTYTHNGCRSFGNEVMSESSRIVHPDASESSNYCGNTVKLRSGQSSCKSCGNLLDVLESRPTMEEHPSIFVSAERSSQVSKRSNFRYANSSLEQEQELEVASGRMPLDHGGHTQWHLTSQLPNSQNLASPNHFKDRNRSQAGNALPGDRFPSQLKFGRLQFNGAASAANATSDAKDFVALNRCLSGRTRLRGPTKVEDIKFDKKSQFDSGHDDCLSPGQKRRSTNVRRQRETSGPVTSINKPSSVSNIQSAGKAMRRNGRSGIQTCTESQPAHQGESNRPGCSDNKNNDGMAFTFSSPMKQRGGIPAKVVRRRDLNTSSCKSTPLRESISNQNDKKICLQNSFPLTGDTLGALLEEKLKELTSQVQDVSLMSDGQPKRTTAKIFQELIRALNMERPLPENDVESTLCRNSACQHHPLMSNQNVCFCFQAKPKTSGASVGYVPSTNHLSPGSVLEASFSTESCCSSSLEDGSGNMQHADSLSYSHGEPQLADFESDVTYSGIFLTQEKIGGELITNLLNYVWEVLCGIDLLRLKGDKLSHAREVIFNAELVLGNPLPSDSNELDVFSICHFLHDGLDTLVSVMWTNFSNFLGFEDTRQGNQLKSFLFDCLIEYLDSRYGRYSNCGYRAWTNLRLHMNTEILIHEIIEEVKSWMGLVGLISDELMERDMSHCLGKWTDFEIEVFETGAELDGQILQTLVDEIILDVSTGYSCRPCH